jgi:hypothetical protein
MTMWHLRSITGEDRRRPRLANALLETAALYGLLTWVYAAVVAAIDLDSINDRLLHWLPLRIDTAGIVGLAASALCFFVLNVRRADGGGRRP